MLCNKSMIPFFILKSKQVFTIYDKRTVIYTAIIRHICQKITKDVIHQKLDLVIFSLLSLKLTQSFRVWVKFLTY